MSPDELYAALVELQRGLDAEQALLVSSRLVLLLAEEIADEAVLRRVLEEARLGVTASR